MKTLLKVFPIAFALAMMITVGEKQGTDRPPDTDDGLALYGEKQGTDRPPDTDDGLALYGEKQGNDRPPDTDDGIA